MQSVGFPHLVHFCTRPLCCDNALSQRNSANFCKETAATHWFVPRGFWVQIEISEQSNFRICWHPGKPRYLVMERGNICGTWDAAHVQYILIILTSSTLGPCSANKVIFESALYINNINKQPLGPCSANKVIFECALFVRASPWCKVGFSTFGSLLYQVIEFWQRVVTAHKRQFLHSACGNALVCTKGVLGTNQDFRTK